MPKYQVSGLPPVTRQGLSAFLPHFNRLAASGAQQYKDGVTGLPGTAGIPVPAQARGPVNPGMTAVAFQGTSTSRDAPDVFYPNLYYAMPERNYRPGLLIQMYDPTRPQDTTHIPVPAVSYRQLWLRHSATLSGGVQSGGASVRNLRQPISQLVNWAQRRTGNGIASG